MRFFCSFIFVILTVSLFSCVYTKDLFSFNYDKNKGGEIGTGDFIQLTDGSIIKGDLQKFKLGLGLLNKAGTITLNDTKYDAKDIVVFQMDSAYYRKVPGIKHFMQRKKVGKINLYYQHFRQSGTDSRGRAYSDEYDIHYIQKGNNGLPQKFTLKLLSEMVADNPKASGLVEEYIKAKRKDKRDSLLDKAIDTYNYE